MSVAFLSLALPVIASADSGSSALPPKDPALHQSYYKMYAPKTQTTYKQFGVVNRKVDDIIKDANNLQAVGGNLMAASTIASGFLATSQLKNPYLLTGASLVGAAGGVLHITGAFGKTSLESFKSGSVIKNVIYFKWTNPNKLEYAVKIESWVEFKGVKVSKVRTFEYKKTL